MTVNEDAKINLLDFDQAFSKGLYCYHDYHGLKEKELKKLRRKEAKEIAKNIKQNSKNIDIILETMKDVIIDKELANLYGEDNVASVIRNRIKKLKRFTGCCVQGFHH